MLFVCPVETSGSVTPKITLAWLAEVGEEPIVTFTVPQPCAWSQTVIAVVPAPTAVIVSVELAKFAVATLVFGLPDMLYVSFPPDTATA